MGNFKELLDLAKQNKKRRTNEHKETTYRMLNSDETYPAFIVDAEHIEDDSVIVLKLVIIKDSFSIERTFKFKLFNGCSVRYDDICGTLGTNGDPSDLIGKCVYIYIERNGDFLNLRVEAEMDKDEFEEKISVINSKSTKAKKKANSKNMHYVKPYSKDDEITNEEDDFEEEFLEDDEEE